MKILDVWKHFSCEPGMWNTYTITVVADKQDGTMPTSMSMVIQERDNGVFIVEYDANREVGYSYFVSLGLNNLADDFRWSLVDPIEIEEADWRVVRASLGDIPQV